MAHGKDDKIVDGEEMTSEQARPIPEGKYFRTRDGYQIHYHEAGTYTAGRPSLLFLHGSGPGASGYSNFKLNYPIFAEAGHHCLAIDYLGFGYSSKPTDIDYTTDLYVEHFRELVEGLGIEQVVPVGNSLGGSLAIAFTLAHPRLVPRLILMAPGGLAPLPTFVPYQVGLHAIQQWLASGSQDIADFRKVLAFLVHDPGCLTEESVTERFAIALGQPKEVWMRRRVRDHVERLGELKAPILCFWGSRDKFIPVAQGLILAERAPDVKLIVSNRCGHWYMVEECADFNAQSIAFLESAA